MHFYAYQAKTLALARAALPLLSLSSCSWASRNSFLPFLSDSASFRPRYSAAFASLTAALFAVGVTNAERGEMVSVLLS